MIGGAHFLERLNVPFQLTWHSLCQSPAALCQELQGHTAAKEEKKKKILNDVLHIGSLILDNAWLRLIWSTSWLTCSFRKRSKEISGKGPKTAECVSGKKT